MNNKPERACAIVQAILNAKKKAILSVADAGAAASQRVEVGLGNGAAMTLQFTKLATVFSLLDAHACPADDDWVTLLLQINGQLKLRLRYRGCEIVLDSFVPGAWERMFGAEPGQDHEVLLPPALRDSSVVHHLRSGLVSYDRAFKPRNRPIPDAGGAAGAAQ